MSFEYTDDQEDIGEFLEEYYLVDPSLTQWPEETWENWGEIDERT